MTSDPSRPLPSAAFGADDGTADPGVAAALADYQRGDGGSAEVLSALAGSRLLVPVVAVLDELEQVDTASPAGPIRAEKSSHMAAVTTVGRDGRRGLLAFTCIDTMRRWDPAARPVPTMTRGAAEAALADGADALVVDLAGPVVFSIESADLRSLASGWRPLGRWPGLASVPAADSRSEQPAPSGRRKWWARELWRSALRGRRG